MSDKARITLELRQSHRDQMERIKDKIDAVSISEVIRRALALYEVVIDELKGGSRLVFRKDGSPDREQITVV